MNYEIVVSKIGPIILKATIFYHFVTNKPETGELRIRISFFDKKN